MKNIVFLTTLKHRQSLHHEIFDQKLKVAAVKLLPNPGQTWPRALHSSSPLQAWVDPEGGRASAWGCRQSNDSHLSRKTIAFNFSPLRVMFAVGLSYIAFIMLRYIPSIPVFWKVFIINGCWILSKASSASIEIIIWLLSFNLLMWYIMLIDLKNPCIPGIKPTWSWCYKNS